jgi:L-lysine exporter family protein LysE/ArgO
MILEKIILGITLAAPIGPVTIEMISRGLERGFWAAFQIRLGAAAGNVLWLVGAFFGLSSLIQYPLIIKCISFIGSLYLIIIGIKHFKKKKVNSTVSSTSLNLERNGLLVGFLISLVNPIGIIFWLSIFITSMGTQEINIINLAYNFFIIVGILLWGAGLSAMLAWGKHLVTHDKLIVISRLAGALLILLGLKYLWANVSGLL